MDYSHLSDCFKRGEHEARASPGDSQDSPWLSDRAGGNLFDGEATIIHLGRKKGPKPLGLIVAGKHQRQAGERGVSWTAVED